LTEKIAKLIARAQENVSSAQLLAKEGYYDASVSRSYYAMFYAAEALLLTRRLKFSSHKAVISLFGQHFVKTGILPAELGRDFSKAFDERLGTTALNRLVPRKMRLMPSSGRKIS